MNSYNEVHGIAINYRIVGNNLRRLRKAKSLRQEDMADLLGISTTHYSNCERGTRGINLEFILAVCHILGVSIEAVIANAITGVSFAMSSDERLNETSRTKVAEWLRKMDSIRLGCSDQALSFMLDACKNLATLDQNRR